MSNVHDIPLDELVELVLKEPEEDDIASCAVCHGWMSIKFGLEPTALCNPCAQTAAIRLAEAMKEKKCAT